MNENTQNEWEQQLPPEFQESLQQIRTEAAPGQSVQRFLFQAENITMTSAAWKRGLINMIWALPVLWGIPVMLAVGLKIYYSLSFITTLMLIFFSMFPVAFAFLLLVAHQGKQVRGQLLLDCGPHPARNLFYLNVCTMTLMGVGFLLSGDDWISGSPGLCFLLIAAMFLMFARGRLQIYEGGIWEYWELLEWHRLLEHSWTEGDPPTLQLKVIQKLFYTTGRGALPVSSKHREAVEELLKQYGPASISESMNGQ